MKYNILNNLTKVKILQAPTDFNLKVMVCDKNSLLFIYCPFQVLNFKLFKIILFNFKNLKDKHL